jgi:hypothetical protein
MRSRSLGYLAFLTLAMGTWGASHGAARAQTQPPTTKPAETMPARAMPAATAPAEPKPAEMKPAAAKPAEPNPAAAAMPTEHLIPPSLAVEHKETMERLAILSRHPGRIGVIARKAMVLFRRHAAREREYILPPLTLLLPLAEGKVSPDMKWALAMTDRVRADREEIFQEHSQLTDIMNELAEAARRAHDRPAAEFAETAATDSLNDVEILEPTVVLIGEYLHEKLAAGH